MEFNKKLQQLRKEKGITQEELAKSLYVSRTAVSKWESGRGYPNLDSLKDIAKYFDISIDELLSNSELLSVAEKDNESKKNFMQTLLFGLLDISMAILLFLPFFTYQENGKIYEVSLINLTGKAVYLKVIFYISILGLSIYGILQICLQKFGGKFCLKIKRLISLILSVILAVIFIISMQPYACILTFIFLIIKGLMVIKW